MNTGIPRCNNALSMEREAGILTTILTLKIDPPLDDG
jgi:hypothetical protein